ncbi:ATP-binding cassette domain-containing protein [Curvibacter sp. CHRR-16]|uniref:ABC transporter ATP-binding protein n=1 Tax=Curvibacter sp. CHRR-16 TaxID=2835872 RepID=UPI001BD9E64E|nr:ATP-binding cassette domain-containing protein [Curvibacter sp. CHRR-16]MBT0571340.1 ATP-binding cassette domain-containing protein [Curvibacter sp. CHRR-16]
MITTRSLSHRYPGTQHALSFPDIDLPQGHTLLLSGPSGSGKSTWLALVAGLMPVQAPDLAAPDAWQFVVAGQNMAQLAPQQADAWRARAIGFLPQKLHLSPALTVQQNLALAQWAARSQQSGVERQQAIHRALDVLDVAALAGRKPAQLSGGQAQRVALARAVLQAPQVLLADEPTASLDDDSAHAALGLLYQTAQRLNASLVIATHDARVAHWLRAQDIDQNSLHSMSFKLGALSK